MTPPARATDLEALDFAKGGGLLPAIVQHADTGAVLMLGYMSREALQATLARRRVVFFSRSRQELWEKGGTSGHSLELEAIAPDCDGDALLVTARPRGPVCHLGTASCFGDQPPVTSEPVAFLATLEEFIAARAATSPEGSYTAELLASGCKHLAQKVGEEGLEVALAAACGSDTEVVDEVADLLYHVLVLLKGRGITLEQVVAQLRARHAASGGS